MTRIVAYGKGILRCNNTIPLSGHKDTQGGYTYCQKLLDKLDKDGKPSHDGPCSPNQHEA